MSNAYFASLQFSDLTSIAFTSQHLGRRELAVYRSAGMALFIVVGYLRKPSRLLRTIRNLARGRSESAIEQRLDQLFLLPVRRVISAVRTKEATT
jgi:hypothetical protein